MRTLIVAVAVMLLFVGVAVFQQFGIIGLALYLCAAVVTWRTA